VSNLIKPTIPGLSPSKRAWLRFKRNRLGYWSLVIFCILVGISLMAEVVSNDRPWLVRYQGQMYFPMFNLDSSVDRLLSSLNRYLH